MEPIKTHQPCPMCGSSDAFAVYPDGHGFCFSCNKTERSNMKEFHEHSKLTDTNYRGIPQWACDVYGIETYGIDNNTVTHRVYRQGKATKVRECSTKSFRQSGGKVGPLFGSDKFERGCSHYITVTEGEEDAAAAFYMLNSKADGSRGAAIHPVVALPGATISKKDREVIHQYLSSFPTVKLCIEDDEPGRRLKATLAAMLPNKVRHVPLTIHKDANAYLIEGDIKQFKGAWDNAGLYTPDNIFHSKADIENILDDEQDESFIPTGFDSLDAKIRGLSRNHVTLITAQEGMGKTELLRAFEYAVVKSGAPVAVLHFEETKSKLIRAISCYEVKENMRESEDKQRISDAFADLSRNYEDFYIFEFKHEPTVDDVIDQLQYLVHVHGIQYVFVDPINQFDPPPDVSKVDFLDDLSKKMEKFCCQNPVGLVWTAHVDDEGRTRNSRMIAKACSTRIDLSRNLLSEDEDERNTLQLVVSKNRQFGETGPAGSLWFNNTNFTIENLIEVEQASQANGFTPF